MKETFCYRGYSAELTWSVIGNELRATAEITATPQAAQVNNCYCSRFGYLSTQGMGNKKLSLSRADREAIAKRFAIKTKDRLKHDIDDHLKKGCV